MPQTHLSRKLWTAVDHYIDDLLIEEDDALLAARSASAAAGLPQIAVTASQGKLLFLLAKMVRAKRILEIGTLGGYSTIWMARALPRSGRVVTLESDAKHFAVSRENIARAGLARVVDQKLGPALKTLPKIAAEDAAPFDFVFIDADKENTAAYFGWALRMARAGTAILVDNVIRDGAVADPTTKDASVKGVQRFHSAVAREPRVSATTIQTVGSKGYDGFTLVLVLR